MESMIVTFPTWIKKEKVIDCLVNGIWKKSGWKTSCIFIEEDRGGNVFEISSTTVEGFYCLGIMTKVLHDQHPYKKQYDGK
jgi:hypothetical protein